ncbi:MAG: DMT family transporter, partial [Eubacteriales bacterium]|nr:DMT family transporter [Eubacteriales bacterium]
MLELLAVLSGVLSAITVAQNGDLALYLGNTRSTVVVHAVGLVTILLFLLFRREKPRWDRATPWYGYFGGIMGVLTVLGCNARFAALGVSVSVA